MKKPVSFTLLTAGAVLVGFVVGFGVGQGTRKAAPSHVTTSLDGATVTIKADLGGALKQGVLNFATGS